MVSLVSLVRVKSSQEEIKNSISEAVNLLKFKIDEPVRFVAIKPNLCYYWTADTGYTTDPRVVAGIIDWVREEFGANADIKIVEADATAMRTKFAFRMLGYERLAEEKKIDLFNLSEDSIIEKKLHVNGQEIKFKIPQFLLNADLFINVPKLKIMRETCISCAMKNIFGCIASPKKIVYHPVLNEAIVGVNKILHPHLTIVDGLVTLGRSPFKLGMIMASIDPFSIDWVASQIMSYNPRKIKFLKMATEEKIGNPNNIITCGETLVAFRTVFPKANFFQSRRLMGIRLGLLRLYSKIVGDIIPPVLEES